MDLIEILKDDHAYFRSRFQQLKTLVQSPEMLDNKSLIRSLVNEIRKRHQIHLRRETEILIPALLDVYRNKKIKPTDAFLLHHLQEEHLSVGRNVYLLAQEVDTHAPSPSWEKILDLLTVAYLPHMEHEEKGLFPEAEKLLTREQLIKMARVAVSEDQ